MTNNRNSVKLTVWVLVMNGYLAHCGSHIIVTWLDDNGVIIILLVVFDDMIVMMRDGYVM